MMKGAVTANNVIKGKISGGEVVRGLINKFTAEQIGLGNVDNTSDMDKPVSTAQAEAIADAKKAGTDARTVANEAKEDAGRALDNASRTQTDVDSHIATRNNPHGVTIEQIGAAPAGYGYGGVPILLSSTLLRSDAELEAVLEPIFSEMAGFGTKLIQFVGYPDNSDYSWFGILSKSSNNYGSLFAHSAYNKGQMISKAKVGGTWQPCEWMNPPMQAGVEYRTTERWNGKAVYTALVSLGTTANNAVVNISSYGATAILRYAGYITGYALPHISENKLDAAWSAYLALDRTGITIKCGTSLAGRTGHCQIWYTKD